MAARPLRLGYLAPDDLGIRRSGVRWLKESGEPCRAHEIVGFCNIGRFEGGADSSRATRVLAAGENAQVGVAAPFAGRLTREPTPTGTLDMLDSMQVWSPDDIIGALEPTPASTSSEPADVELMMFAGRRRTELTEQRLGLLAGWNDRVRAWWGEGGEFGSILGLGYCQLSGMVRGRLQAFLDLFELLPGPAHVVYGSQAPISPSIAFLLEQIRPPPPRWRR